jgi:hypothetical protein
MDLNGGIEGAQNTNSAYTGISIQAAGANLGIDEASTGIRTQPTGEGREIENRPPYYALCFIMKQ